MKREINPTGASVSRKLGRTVLWVTYKTFNHSEDRVDENVDPWTLGVYILLRINVDMLC